MSDAYADFLARKVRMAPDLGFPVEPAEINPLLKDHQRAIVAWAVRGGRRAIFAAFGLGKSVMQLETLRLICLHAGEGARALIVCPLGVRQEFVRDAAMLGLRAKFIRALEEAEGADVYLTNYETVRDGKLDPNAFTAVSLDEASVLRSFGSKTYQTFLTLFEGVRFRFVCTATPSPNRYKELIHYAGFLGVMDTGQALTRFFQRDSTKANNLTLYPHKREEFFLWLNSWGVFLQRPSDLGFSDAGYDLPPLEVIYHEVQVAELTGGVDRDGQAVLLKDAALGVRDAAREKCETLPARVAKLKEVLTAAPEDRFILWHDLEAEREAIEAALPLATYGAWQEFRDGHPDALALYERHYSAYQYADGRERSLFVGPGHKLVLLTPERDALFVWRRFKDASGQEGVNCAVFRNEGPRRSSDLIREAMAIAWLRWPCERLYTYVNEHKTAARRGRASRPGECFIQAGWSLLDRRTQERDLCILEALPGAAVPEVRRSACLASIYGSQDLDKREQAIIDFSEGRFQHLAAKPVIAGSGCNFQRHCHKAVFLGIGFKFNDFVQAIHRIQRFLQTRPVEIHVIYAESEREILRDLQAKWARHKELTAAMSEIIREFGLNHDAMAAALTRSIGVERQEMSGQGWLVAHNDCVEETRGMEADSVDLVVTSIPFSNHYEYTPSYNDFGHTDDDAHFFGQMDHLTPELLRALRPGRVAAIHVKDRILFGSVTGLGRPTVNPFHAKCISHYLGHGFAYLGMHIVLTDVVRENNQTYRLSYGEMLKDSTKMGAGSPEFVLLFCKPQSDRTKGYSDQPVRKDRDNYSLARWQIDADAFWRSSGDRLLTPEELAALPSEALSRAFTRQALSTVYDHEAHVATGEALLARDALPKTFTALAPGSWSDTVWSDVSRMLTLNGEQSKRGLENHICPLQFDIVDRLIRRYSAEGELVFDPFGGLFTVPYRALQLKRRGRAVELNAGYYRDGVKYLVAKEREVSAPTLFDLFDVAEVAA